MEQAENLTNEELLTIYHSILNHLQYLEENLLTLEEENEKDGEEENESE